MAGFLDQLARDADTICSVYETRLQTRMIAASRYDHTWSKFTDQDRTTAEAALALFGAHAERFLIVIDDADPDELKKRTLAFALARPMERLSGALKMNAGQHDLPAQLRNSFLTSADHKSVQNLVLAKINPPKIGRQLFDIARNERQPADVRAYALMAFREAESLARSCGRSAGIGRGEIAALIQPSEPESPLSRVARQFGLK